MGISFPNPLNKDGDFSLGIDGEHWVREDEIGMGGL
jgi:hypothetical protein